MKKNQFKYLVLGIFILITCHLSAQKQRTINGTVTDTWGAPLGGVNVSVKDGKIIAITDSVGKYTIIVPATGYATLTFSHPNKTNASASIGIYDEINVIMSDIGEVPLDLSLEDLLNTDITTVSKKAEKQSDAPGIISVLTKDELDRFGGTTLKDILERVPGLISTSVLFLDATTIASRGDQIKNTSSHVLVLLNGRPVREVLDGGINSEFYNAFPIDIIDRIEVIKGPGSVLYGSDAFSGVINIIAEKAEETQISVAGTGTENGGYGASANATIQKGDLGIVVAGRYLTRPWETYVDDDNSSLSIPDEAIGSYLNINYKTLSLTSSYNSWQTIPLSQTESECKWEKLFGNIGYEFDVNDNWNLDLNATYTSSNNDFSISNKKSENIVAELTNFITLGDKLQLVVGGLYNRVYGKELGQSRDGGMNGTTDTTNQGSSQDADSLSSGSGSSNDEVVAEATKNNFALYAQLDYQVLENLKLIGGLQLNKTEGLDFDLVPRLGLVWYPTQKLNVKALYSTAFRAPSIAELTLSSGAVLGNEDLIPEKVQTFDLGLTYNTQNGQFFLNAFHSKMTDIISVIDSVYTNNTNIYLDGIELGGKYYINKSFYVNASLLYQENENDTTENVSYVSNLGVKAGISYSWDKGVSISLFNIYQGGMDDKYAGEIEDGNELAYNLLNLHTNLDLNKLFGLNIKPKFVMLYNIENILDETYYTYKELDATVASSPGRRMDLSLKVTF